MNYNRKNRNGNTLTIHVMCAVVFMLFSLSWLFFFQADVMAMTQHVLSGGLTRYNRLVGALLITGGLLLLQLVVYKLTGLKKRSHALTYVPSMVILAMLTDVSHFDDGKLSHTVSWWGVLLVVVVFGGSIFLARQLQEVEDDDSYSLTSRPMWINMLLMALLIMGVAWLGNTNAVFHYRMQAERYLAQGDFDKSLKVGKKSLESDRHLLMLRMYALARMDGLGEHLFEYPISGTSSDVLPTNGRSLMLLYPKDSLYRFLGAYPAEKMEPVRYLQMLQRRDSSPQKVIGDYLLCCDLIDKNLDRFVQEVGRYYTMDEQMDEHLPKYYREALTLYNHLCPDPLFVYHNPVTEEDFSNFRDMEKLYPILSERKERVGERYRDTYWYYYEYGQ